MRLKPFLILMTAVAVVSDSMLRPFYPQYFAEVLGVTSPRHVGLYIAACAAIVMLSFPLWAMVARRVGVLRLLIATQLAAGALSVACAGITSLVPFWTVSLAMLVFKASYLLIYPYALSLDEPDRHIGTISLLAFVLYFGNVLAALLSGTMLEWFEPRWLFLAMALGDAVQTGLCVAALRAPRREPPPAPPAPRRPTSRFVLRLGLLMFVLYSSAAITEPFFSVYWERLARDDDRLIAGAVFAIPGVAALLGLWANHRGFEIRILPAVALALAGVLLELDGATAPLLLGRFVYGWALFQTMVRLDALLFARSTPATYAVDFSKVNLFQGLGVLTGSGCAGALVRSGGLAAPFVVGAAGFVAGALLFTVLLREERSR